MPIQAQITTSGPPAGLGTITAYHDALRVQDQNRTYLVMRNPVLDTIPKRPEQQIRIVVEILQKAFLVVARGEPAVVPFLELERGVPVK
jgi:hypothetical protein